MIDTVRHYRIGVSEPELAAFCAKHHIVKLSVFGSAARGELRSDSDVDVLVEFEKGCRVGLIRFAGIERQLSDMIGRTVEMRTPAELSKYFRDEVLRSAEVQYAQG